MQKVTGYESSPERDRICLKSRYILVYYIAVNELEVEILNDATRRVRQELSNYTYGRCVRSQSAHTNVDKSGTCGHSLS